MMYQFLMIKSFLNHLVKNEEGQGMVEYSIILALISVAAIAVILLIGPQITASFQSVNTALTP